MKDLDSSRSQCHGRKERWQDENTLKYWKDKTKCKVWTGCDRILVLKGSYAIYFYRLGQLGTSDCTLNTGWYWNSVNFLGANNVVISHSMVHFVSTQAWVQLLGKTHQLILLPLSARPCVRVLCTWNPVVQFCILLAGCVTLDNLLNLSVPYL